ncbi:MAG: hypothetical protein HQM10_13590 [Candidatus Riflebacteria bacterium]|nr:hypothetical protein [Candidatus Riflebacteria bacterium]
MSGKYIKIAGIITFILSFNVLLFAETGAVGATGPFPWEDPNSGFSGTWTSTNTGIKPGGIVGTTGPTGSTGAVTPQSFDTVDKTIKSSGSTTQNGQAVSNAGVDTGKTGTSHQDAVNDYLNNAANTIAGTSGSASAWSWSKSWKIGPDGKPYEVRESYHQGSLNLSGKNNPGQTPATQTPTSTTPATNPSNPANPNTTPVATPGTTPNPTSGTPPANSPVPTAANPSTPANSTPDIPCNNPTAANPSSAGSDKTSGDVKPDLPPVDAAPISIPNPILSLSISDPTAAVDQPPFPTIFDPNDVVNTVPPEVLSRVASAVPEDTRVKFSLDLLPPLDTSKVRVTFVDPDDQQVDLPYQRTFYHLYRTPSNTSYFVKVYYPDPITNKNEEILSIAVPVYKMGFGNQTIQHNQQNVAGN